MPSKNFDINSIKSLNIFVKEFKLTQNPKTIFYVHSKHCGYCVMFNDEWKQFTKQLPSDISSVKIESSFIRHLSDKYPEIHKIISKMFEQSTGVPNIAKYNSKSKRVIRFTNNRSIEALNQFLK
jgi:hypothetical protein